MAFCFIGAGPYHPYLSPNYLRQLVWPNIYIRQQCVEDNDYTQALDNDYTQALALQGNKR